MAPTTSTSTTKKVAAPKKVAAHPSFQQMITEAVQAHMEDTRHGVSRQQIKKYLAEKYKLDMSSASNVNHLSKAIARGAETKAFELPKGSGGRIKLAKVVKAPVKKASTANKENKPVVKKAAAKKPAAKKTTAAKPAAKKATGATAAKKPAAKKTVAKKPLGAKSAAAKPAAAKKAVAKKPAAAKKTVAKK